MTTPDRIGEYDNANDYDYDDYVHDSEYNAVDNANEYDDKDVDDHGDDYYNDYTVVDDAAC